MRKDRKDIQRERDKGRGEGEGGIRGGREKEAMKKWIGRGRKVTMREGEGERRQ